MAATPLQVSASSPTESQSGKCAGPQGVGGSAATYRQRVADAGPELLAALQHIVDVCESPDFDHAPSDAAMLQARALLGRIGKPE